MWSLFFELAELSEYIFNSKLYGCLKNCSATVLSIVQFLLISTKLHFRGYTDIFFIKTQKY